MGRDHEVTQRAAVGDAELRIRPSEPERSTPPMRDVLDHTRHALHRLAALYSEAARLTDEVRAPITRQNIDIDQTSVRTCVATFHTLIGRLEAEIIELRVALVRDAEPEPEPGRGPALGTDSIQRSHIL